jgi:predicted hydrocarbon binding protein
MHGLILVELQRYARGSLGADGWQKVLAEAGLQDRRYRIHASYPDQEAAALVQAAVRVTGQPAATLLEDFGEFVAPSLLMIYKVLIEPDWKTLDLIEHTEDSIHTALRDTEPAASPPALAVERVSPTAAVLTYRSPRRMCALAKGIAKGIATHYGERLTITDTACMSAGAPACRIEFRVG